MSEFDQLKSHKDAVVKQQRAALIAPYIEALSAIVDATAGYHQYDIVGRPWLANAIKLTSPPQREQDDAIFNDSDVKEGRV